MATLTNRRIKNTYDGLLKTNDEESIPVSGTVTIQDGLGNNSAMSLGRDGEGMNINGNVNISAGTTGDAILVIESDTDNIGSENDNPHLHLKQDAGGVQAKFGLEGGAGNTYSNSISNATYLGTIFQQPLQFITGDTGSVQTAKMTITPVKGYVGIGETAPTHKLELYDDRTDDDSDDYTVVVKTSLPSPIPTPNPGTGGIKAVFSNNDGSTFPYGISMVPGTSSCDIMATEDLAIYANSDLDTVSATGSLGRSGQGMNINGKLNVKNESLSNVGLTVQQSVDSSVDMQQWKTLGGTVKALVDSEGKIGINLTNPSKELDVRGEIRTARPSAEPDGFAHVALNSQYTGASGIFFQDDGGQFLLKDADNNQNVKLCSNADSYVKGRFGVGDLLTGARTNSKFFVKNGDIQIDRPDTGTHGGGIILHTPDKQKRFKITIDDNGNLVTTQV